METLELTLVKTQSYKLKPFGRFQCFQFGWKDTKRTKGPCVIWIGEMNIDYNTGMPLTDEQEKYVIKLMKKTKSDVFTGLGGEWGYKHVYFTRTGVGWAEIKHHKLTDYARFLIQQGLEDNEEAWNTYLNK